MKTGARMKKKKNPAAVQLGRKGGLARKKNLTKDELSKIGKVGAEKRWAKKEGE
jgi:hypothetical protein